MTRVKICGITRPQDAVTAADAGVDAIGLVFAKSPRLVTPSRAREIVAALPPFVTAVGVFVNARPVTIRRIADFVGFSTVQLHGDESPARVAELAPLHVIKALRVRDRSFVDDLARFRDAGVCGILLDAYSPTARGGSGKRFDWDLVNQARQAGALDFAPPLILAGGLTPQNVRTAIRSVRPHGVDVSGGVESSPGVKSADLIERFIAAVASA